MCIVQNQCTVCTFFCANFKAGCGDGCGMSAIGSKPAPTLLPKWSEKSDMSCLGVLCNKTSKVHYRQVVRSTVKARFIIHQSLMIIIISSWGQGTGSTSFVKKEPPVWLMQATSHKITFWTGQGAESIFLAKVRYAGGDGHRWPLWVHNGTAGCGVVCGWGREQEIRVIDHFTTSLILYLHGWAGLPMQSGKSCSLESLLLLDSLFLEAGRQKTWISLWIKLQICHVLL